MHAGDQYYREAIQLMTSNKGVYADLSVLSNPQIVDSTRFVHVMKAFAEAKLTDRLLFGTDNGDIGEMIASIERLSFLSASQKKAVYYKNAEKFFRK